MVLLYPKWETRDRSWKFPLLVLKTMRQWPIRRLAALGLVTVGRRRRFFWFEGARREAGQQLKSWSAF